MTGKTFHEHRNRQQVLNRLPEKTAEFSPSDLVLVEVPVIN
jgi:hypothetical protein